MNDYAADIRNGDVLKVEEIDKRRHELVLQAADGAMVRLSFAKPIHVEHAYAFTVHSTQGTTSDRVIVDACTRSATANEAAFYVAISRAREHASIYTDDLAGLPEAMSRVSEKTRALDVARPVARARHEALV
jgi:ATP-dependent exoDNAse (exonuclease V) alpha subunit